MLLGKRMIFISTEPIEVRCCVSENDGHARGYGSARRGGSEGCNALILVL